MSATRDWASKSTYLVLEEEEAYGTLVVDARMVYFGSELHLQWALVISGSSAPQISTSHQAP